MRVPVYDIKNCGPRHRFVANGKLVHNSDSINMQNLPRTSPLKKAILAPAGYVFIDSDSSQIEARTLAWLAGQDDLVTAFANGEDVYKIMASAIYGKAEEDITKDERFVGKTTILGCLAEGTLVLTDRGWVAIEAVTVVDRLWDGDEWVCHQGLVQKGTKETLSLCGLWLTPDHRVLCGTNWVEAQYVTTDESTRSLALGTGAVSWLYPDTSKDRKAESLPSSCVAIAGDPSTQSILATSRPSEARAALSVVGGKGTRSGTGGTYPPCLTPRTDRGFSTVWLPPSLVVIPQPQSPTLTTGVGEYTYVQNGARITLSSYVTYRPSPGGTTHASTWTELTTTGVTSPITSGSCLGLPITPTDEKSASCRRSLMTYDLAYAGPRNRYTVATDEGPIIVHNCGYGMGAAKFQAQLKNFGVDTDLDECQRIISTYRETYECVPELWQEAGTAIRAMINDKTAPIGRAGVLQVEGAKGIRLPNGLYLPYPNLREQEDEETGKREFVYDTKRGRAVIPTRLYGGKLIENVCQALARIVIGEQMLKVSRRYRPVMTVHDAIAVLAPESEADEAQAYVEKCMKMRPAWGMELPLNCEAGYGASYGECK